MKSSNAYHSRCSLNAANAEMIAGRLPHLSMKHHLSRRRDTARFSPNQSLQPTAGHGDDQLEFMKQIVDIAKARSRQR
jgi:hypothetical protein